MMREVMKCGGGIFILLLVGLGCGSVKLPWAKNPQPAPPPEGAGTTPEQPPTPPNPVLPAKTLTPSENKKSEVVGAIAQYNLALKLEAAGKLPEAAALYQKAADQNQTEAQYNLGYAFFEGKGLLRSDVNAALWFQKAADQGLADAQHMMGFLYTEGRGVTQDFAQAANWCRKAAEQGHPDAQFYFGCLHVEGKGVKANSTEAAKWFRRAAENGVVDAQFQIGIYLARGEGVEQDVVEGYKWLNIASFKNHQEAKIARAELLKQMRPDAVTEAQKRTGEYIAEQQQK